MSDAASGKLRHDLGRGARHPPHHSPDGSGRGGTRTENENGFLAVGPRAKAQDRLEGLAADDQRIHSGHELIVAVRLAVRREPIESAISSSNETVEAGADKDGRF